MPPPLTSPLGATFALARAPHPWVAAAFRWLLARVLLGFGKKKCKICEEERMVVHGF